jgi:hypothetical protein
VEHFVLVSEVEKQGKRIHAKLIQYRVAKEFYDIELGTAKLLFDLTLRKLSDDHDPVRKIAEIDLGEVNLEN